jgi:hypothetical protein
MRLVRRHLEPGASIPLIQLQHRKDAVEYAIQGIRKHCDANIAATDNDLMFKEFEPIMRDWVIETLYQGAYLREYHLWEKDCKEYFAVMARRNGEIRQLRSSTFVPEVVRAVAEYGLTLEPLILERIREMNQKVNVMKHDPGLNLDHFITREDYAKATDAIEQFWDYMLINERW